MAENVTLARPYAEAVFALARDAGKLSAWREALERLAQVVADASVRECLTDPRFELEPLQKLLVESAGLPADVEQINFVRLLLENGRAQVLPEIAGIFGDLADAYEGVRDALVSSAFPLDTGATARLQTDLEARFGVKLRLQVRVDPELIGGVRVAVGDEVIDASVRGKLAAMAAALQN
ncbi:MAG: F0F1 ATP synthase subunit delta [Candidatus Dactylopiibacterium carminicum]|uniref:ATP synthase subunit delta n=1 Tax=Candidatus Dactylopiibacterium carminicum TaxID=857335 RepID=A0A272EMY5_9RHOO|nr:F0F1 ATP synthase subunit delta [Candidatus Dactylopiibacterium carminicum]KAF7597899.1 F0F1 ATP synthase subunit delta [Candidatus Dactylopiibacterium carminicum]PAS91474.1 MAG: F0F1 ATP synthase subunit delta [Candidatus Dactylopiibacterium carminicum]PAS92924.1 MAG: F0F1 ATP synthase subunit delta [Candidatus Dactylopiibacterium carminicum]PAS95890.1 MAG: ATP synthase F1 subunit delta [Candidatus Dactylopiibacterium carminicum]